MACTVTATALLVSACGGDDETRSAPPASATTAVSEAEAAGAGSGDVAQFAAPTEYWCLDGDPEQAQATLGWSVPRAKGVKVFLDGEQLHSGIRKQLPFSVLAGDAPGIGTTVVFSCEGDDEHRIDVRWQLKGSSPPAERTVTIAKATDA